MTSRRKYTIRGLIVGLLILFLGLAAIFVPHTLNLVQRYNGQCGSFLPFLGSGRPCSLAEFLMSHLQFTAAIMVFYLWPIALLSLLLPALIGYIIGRKKEKQNAENQSF
jgi:hypothetical protein